MINRHMTALGHRSLVPSTSEPEHLNDQEPVALRVAPSDVRTAKRSAFTFLNLSLNFAFIAALFLVNSFGIIGNIISLSCLAILGMTSVSNALKALSLLAIIIMGNPYIVEKSIVLTYFRFPLIALFGLRIFYDVFRKRPDLIRMAHLNGLLAFGLVCVILAPINGYFAMIAILKAGLFTYGAYIILIGTEFNRRGFSDLTVWFTAMIAFIIIGTYATIPLGLSHVFRGELLAPGIGSAGLSGITTHQQTLGSFAAVSAIFCFALGVFSRLPKRWIFILLFLSLFPILVMTRSRTAVATLILSVLFAIAVAPFILRGRKAYFNKFKPSKWIAGGILLLITGLLADATMGGVIRDRIMDFALKGLAGRVTHGVEFEDLAGTRLWIIQQSWAIFLQSPWTGINFGTSISPYFVQHASILTAPTEKGFILTAVLEEVGIIGAIFFTLFIYLLCRKLYRDENIIGLAVFGGFFIQNFGEMMFFSFGGAGLYGWSVVGAAIAVGYRHQFVRPD